MGEALQLQSRDTSSVTEPGPAEAEGWQLVLPSDAAFVQARLPAADAERYRGLRQQRRIWVGQSHLSEAAFTANEDWIVAKSDNEARVRVYDRRGRLLANHELGLARFDSGALSAWPAPIGELEPGDQAAFVLGGSSGIGLYAAKSGLYRQLSPVAVDALRWSPDATLLVARTQVRSEGSALLFFRRGAGAVLEGLRGLAFPGRVEGWDLSRDNRFLSLSLYPQQQVWLVDLHSGDLLAKVAAPNYARDVSLSPDGRWLAVGGQGLLLVDLSNPARRAFYSHFYNNIHCVRFSPAGDVVATSSYDGRIRLFAIDPAGPELRLLQTLRHDGNANVYSIEFSKRGDSLLSASGDQTLRVFTAPVRGEAAGAAVHFYGTVEQWRAGLPPELLSGPPVIEPSMRDGHYHPPELDQPARSANIRPGRYACKVSSLYRLRDCTVSRTPTGHTMLEFHEGNLVAMKGVLYDDGPVLRYLAWPTAPFIGGCPGCEQQPVQGILRGAAGNYRGVLSFRSYYDPRRLPAAPPADVKIEDADDRYSLQLQFRAPLPERKPGHDAMEPLE